MLTNGTAQADSATPVANWIRHNAIPLNTTEPAASLADLMPLQRSIGDASIVGLGESVHGAAEELTLKHRVLRLLVERMGFRSIAWEEDWAMGVRLDDYILTGNGDLAQLVREMSPQWPSREVEDTLRWLRTYNTQHADKVRLVGVDFFLLQQLAYDAVAEYVATTAPHRLSELQTHLAPIRPQTTNIFDWILRYKDGRDKRPYIRSAHAVHDLVAEIPHRAGDRTHALALQHARQIVSFYIHHSLEGDAPHIYRDAQAARNLRWWRSYSGNHKIVYWAASPHTAVDSRLRIVMPPRPSLQFAGVGWYLRSWYGDRYRSIGFTFDHGAISAGPGQTITAPPPAAHWFEKPFGAVRHDQFALDLRVPAPPPVQRWLRAPVTTRAPNAGPDSFVAGTSLGQWFDLIIHRQRISPAHSLDP